MEGYYHAYMAVLVSVHDNLKQLVELTQKEKESVQDDDLAALNEILNKEQAIALTLRGLEQKRELLLVEMGLTNVPLSQLAGHFPAELRDEITQIAEDLVKESRRYSACSKETRSLLQHTLREIERTLSILGVEPAVGTGYKPHDGEPALPMKTDFRA